MLVESTASAAMLAAPPMRTQAEPLL
jgi:hypothetical protein